MASVDVLIPNFNYGRYLRGCAESVLSQDIEELRLLIIDNASTDDSAEIAREIARSDPRVEIRIREKNLGLHASLNEGIDWAASEYFLILCSDDLLVPGALRLATKIMQDNPRVHLAYGSTLWHTEGPLRPAPDVKVDAPTRMYPGSLFLDLMCRAGLSFLGGHAVVFRTSVQKKAGYYTASLVHMCDVEMWMRIALFGSVAEIGADLLVARRHGSNRQLALRTYHDRRVEMKAVFDAFFTGAGAVYPGAARLQRESNRILALQAYSSWIAHLLRGESGAGELLSFVLRIRPSLVFFPPLISLFCRPDAWSRIRLVAKQAAARLSTRADSSQVNS